MQIQGISQTTLSFNHLLEGLIELTESCYAMATGKGHRLKLKSTNGRDEWGRIQEETKCRVSTKASLFYVLKPPASPVPLRVDCDTNRVDVTRLWFLPETTSILAAAGKTNPNDTIF